MTTNILSPQWRGERAAPVDPATICFTAIKEKRGNECAGCLFEHQSAAICDRAIFSAVAKDLPHCSPRTGSTFIYVLDRMTDPRQIRIKNTTE
jgi:hypothetical protein